jgi:hypothetical protein
MPRPETIPVKHCRDIARDGFNDIIGFSGIPRRIVDSDVTVGLIKQACNPSVASASHALKLDLAIVKKARLGKGRQINGVWKADISNVRDRVCAKSGRRVRVFGRHNRQAAQNGTLNQ